MDSSSVEVGGRLNAFQRVMLQWSSLHPYNAVHVCKLAGPLRSECLSTSVAHGLERLGLGLARLSADGEHYQHAKDANPEIEFIAGGQQADQRLEEFTNCLLNRPFDRPVLKPFRFAAIDAGPHEHFVVLAYDHWVADSTSARHLLREVLGEYLNPGRLLNRRSISIRAPTGKSFTTGLAARGC